MKLSEFKDLEKNITHQNFRDNYKTINIIMFILSILGNITSVFLAYFLVDKVFFGINENYPIFDAIATVVLLSSLELLKRDFFNKFSFLFLKAGNAITKDVMPLALISLLIVSLSFYSSIKGAKIFSTKSTQIELKSNDQIKQFNDSIQKLYAPKIASIQNEIILKKQKIESKDQEETNIQSQDEITWQQRSRVQDLKNQQKDLKSDIVGLDSDQVHMIAEQNNIIKQNQDAVSQTTNKQKNENSSNSIIFIIISSIVEITILAGVFFNKYYKYRSYTDFKKMIDKDPNYQKWVNYNDVLNIIYSEEAKIGDKLSSTQNLAEICKINGINISVKDLSDMLKLLSSIGVIRTAGPSRYFQKTKEASVETLKNHFNIS